MNNAKRIMTHGKLQINYYSITEKRICLNDILTRSKSQRHILIKGDMWTKRLFQNGSRLSFNTEMSCLGPALHSIQA